MTVHQAPTAFSDRAATIERVARLASASTASVAAKASRSVSGVGWNMATSTASRSCRFTAA